VTRARDQDRSFAGRGIAAAAGLVALALASLALLAGAQPAAADSVFVANCGNPGFLEVEPDYWSYGCTSGSALVRPLRWVSYGRRRAVARGTAIVQNCGCYDPTAVGRYPARLVLTGVRHCPNTSGWRYFGRARLTITYPRGNPFGKPAGPAGSSYPTTHGPCDVAP
jgi:hypothetical protein